MDNRPNLHESLFSRNSTPPTNPEQHPFSPHLSSSPSIIETLFHGPPPPSDHNLDIEKYDTPSAVPNAPLQPDPGSNLPSATDRQNALLSLFNPTTTTRSQPLPQPPQGQPQQVPTPPGSSSRSNASPQQPADSQKLLEQILGGTSSRSTNYSDTQRSNPQAPSPPYTQRDDFKSFAHDRSTDTSPRTRPLQQVPVLAQPPSPRRSMFEFTSAFDHLSSTTAKKKPAPQPTTNPADDAWNTVTDPKRQSVENLLENLTRGQPQSIPQTQPPAYEAYLSNDFQQSESSVTQASSRPPLPPIPSNQKPLGIPPIIPNITGSPRSGSPKPLRQTQVNSSQPLPYPGSGNRRDKESSPARGKSGSQRAQQPQSKFTKPPVSPGPQSQTIVFDVAQPLGEVQARDSVKSTAIALVRQDAIFLPGTTIGATHWVAYAMTRGRVRVISRSSGDRTLLQLPQIFASASSVIDMAVYGNRLAGVTSDGGFVVWELPEVIMDDVPGRILLCVPPTPDDDAIRAVKWHPKDADTLAIASDNKVFVIDLANTQELQGHSLPHSDLYHLGPVFNVPSAIVAFDFDVQHYSIATISEDSSLTIWNINDSLPYASHKVYGDDIPSSLTFVDGGIVIGRRNGTIFQLLSGTTKTVLSTVKFTSSAQEDPDMFGHISYDSRIRTLWIANIRRESLIALKIHMDTSFEGGEEVVRGYIEQVAEFSGIKPTIHFVILTADSDPHGDEAHAACTAAKIAPTELALVAFSVHSTGVDQVLIRKEWFDSALAQADSKFPLEMPPVPPPPLPASVVGGGSALSSPVIGPPDSTTNSSSKPQRQPLPVPPSAAPQSQQPNLPLPFGIAAASAISVGAGNGPPPAVIRSHTPPSDEVENDFSEGRSDQKNVRSGGLKGKSINWKEREESSKDRDKAGKSTDAAAINDASLGQALSREMKKTEESLHNRIGKLIGKEMEKQHQRLEDARMHEQAEEYARQEKILKLISSELTRNTTRVVEQAVKTEVQQSVLPALENITRAEVKAVLSDQVGSGVVELINRGLPVEIEKILLRPSISNHYATLLIQALSPVIERQIKESMNTAFVQFHAQHSTTLQQEIMRELRNEIAAIKSDLGTRQNESLRSQETTIRDLERTVRSLSEQVKYLTINTAPPAHPQMSTLHHLQQPQQAQNTPPAPPPTQLQPSVGGPSHLRGMNLAPPSNGGPTYTQPIGPFQQTQPQPPIHQQWYTGIAAPQASHPATIPQPSTANSQGKKTPPPKTTSGGASGTTVTTTSSDEWDTVYLDVLTSQDVNRLRSLLSRTNPELVLPLTGPPLVSQAVILTLVHRLSGIVGETAPTDELFKTMLWWLQRVANLVRPEDKLISDFIPRVIPTVQQSLNTTKQRLAILPGGSGTIEAARQLNEVQDVLRRKVPV